MLEPKVAGDVEMDLAHFEAPFPSFLDHQIFIAARQRRHDPGGRLAQHDDIAIRTCFAAIDTDDVIERAVFTCRTFAGTRDLRVDEVINRLAALELAKRSGLEDRVFGEESSELVELAVIDMKAIGRHQLAYRLF